MLTAMRRLASTWFAKALFLLLVLSFAIWGIEDVVRNFGNGNAVATVNGDPIELPEAQLASRREIARIQRQLGSNFQVTPQIAEGVSRQAVENLVMERVQRQEANRLGVAAPDAAVRDYVWSIPAFQGADGRFSRPLMEGFLRGNGMTEGEFLVLLRSDLQRQQLAGAIRAGAAGPDALTRPLLAWQQERRLADLVVLPLAEAPEPAAPDDAQLRRFHENNPDRFSSPEYRRVTVLTLSPAIVAAEVQPSEDDLRAAYEARRAQFEVPEKRALEQAVMQSQDAANKVAAEWRAGAAFPAIEALAQQQGGQAVSLGTVGRDELPVPELATAAFALPPDGVSDPVQTAFGWHVLKVTGIQPAQSRSFDQVRAELAVDVTREKAADLAYERANEVEDALAGGATLEEVGQRFGLPVAKLVVDARGQTQDGTPAQLNLDGGGRDVALRAIFTAETGQAPRLAEAGQVGLFAFDLQDVMPAALRPFDQVRDQVLAAWTADARRRSQEERAAALLGAVRGGKSLPDAAREAGLAPRRVGPFPRQADAQGDGRNSPPPELLAPLFDTAEGQATMAEIGGGFAVGQVAGIIRPDTAADPLGLGRVRTEVEQAMLSDLEAQYLEALRRGASVSVNPTLMGQVSAR
ncbi:peptidylprolyl isomerase [Roseomonas haemaphysalidis]|uniref:Parvulin-like PPIase n=1 Tax=Roseomonas haemaphysalidis TaxID=2768162 RepID=A0ABS3KSC7_9PROT|nr:SurA N-terminal domain-containing protein [Roseomonas haemaphysalidis]MBO1080364.1 SurA N-terminal domain-containing protein [Roseomonas haemaphysalidis]